MKHSSEKFTYHCINRFNCGALFPDNRFPVCLLITGTFSSPVKLLGPNDCGDCGIDGGGGGPDIDDVDEPLLLCCLVFRLNSKLICSFNAAFCSANHLFTLAS